MKILKNYERACNEMVKWFIEEYYCYDNETYDDVYKHWIGDDIGGIIGINDNFWSIDSIKQVMYTKPKSEQLFSWYHYQIENETSIRLDPYLKLKYND